MPDNSGPTAERVKQAGGLKGGFIEIGGSSRDGHRFFMRDSPLGRALVRSKISGEEYSGLRTYAIHWFAGGLGGHLGSVDLNRVLAFDPGSMTGLARTESQANHRIEFYEARELIGRRPAFVADCIACREIELEQTGHWLGFRSPYRARCAALGILRDAGDRLAEFWRRQR